MLYIIKADTCRLVSTNTRHTHTWRRRLPIIVKWAPTPLQGAPVVLLLALLAALWLAVHQTAVVLLPAEFAQPVLASSAVFPWEDWRGAGGIASYTQHGLEGEKGSIMILYILARINVLCIYQHYMDWRARQDSLKTLFWLAKINVLRIYCRARQAAL